MIQISRGFSPLKSIHTDQYSAFLKLIVTARKQAGLTQQELAEKLNRPQSYVSKYERGERRLDVVEFLDIAKLLNVDPIEFITKLSGNPRQQSETK